jgi:hypothetical protein
VIKKVALGFLFSLVLVSLASAQIIIGTSNILAPGAELVIKSNPISYTIGGTYRDGSNYLVSGSAVLNNGLGVSAIYNGGTQNYVANIIAEKEASLSNDLAVVGGLNLISYSSSTQQVTALNGASVGLRIAIL